MKIREGAYYRRRRGDVVGPLTGVTWCDRTFMAADMTWHENGSYVLGLGHEYDLIAEVYVSDTPPADAPAPETIRLDPRTEWKLFRQMGPHELVTNASVPMLETKTLRDEIAIAALTGFMADPNVLLPTCDFNATAEGLYAIADAMMEARKK
jgi:hypothetical protein